MYTSPSQLFMLSSSGSSWIGHTRPLRLRRDLQAGEGGPQGLWSWWQSRAWDYVQGRMNSLGVVYPSWEGLRMGS